METKEQNEAINDSMYRILTLVFIVKAHEEKIIDDETMEKLLAFQEKFISTLKKDKQQEPPTHRCCC